MIHGLKCETATSIAEVDPEVIKEAFRKVNSPEVDALLQAGTNLPAARVAAEMENASCGKVFSRCFVIEVLPEPDGAVMIIILSW